MLSMENRVNMVSMESIPYIFGFVKFFAIKLHILKKMIPLYKNIKKGEPMNSAGKLLGVLVVAAALQIYLPDCRYLPVWRTAENVTATTPRLTGQ